MRTAFLLLLTANLGFWAWTHWIKAAPPRVSRYDGAGITLLRELPADSPLRSPLATGILERVRSPAAASGGASSAAAAGDRCVAIGPFVDAAEADAAAALLTDEGIDVARFVGEDEVWDGYWVYIEQIASREEARSLLAELRAEGIDDAYMIPDSDSGILISLGVFTEISGAGTLAERVNRLGLEATITERRRLAETTWLQMNLTAAIDLLDLLGEPGRITRLEARDCSAAAD